MSDESMHGPKPVAIGRDEWCQLEPFVDHAMQLSAERRSAYIAELRLRDGRLAADVERFIADAEAPDPRMDISAPEQFAYLLDENLPTPLAPNTVLADRYVIHEEIGRGGMAIVYRASDMKLNQASVAVKVLRRGSLTAKAARRFDEEIRLTSKLRHPNIVQLYDRGQSDEHAFFVMPHIEGETLRARIEREPSGRLPISEALRIAIEVARALEYAHAHNVIHRDVKPSNLLLTSGVAMLADFGIARAEIMGEANGGDPLTEVGYRAGTPAYMSPEQSDGSDAVDSQTDIYSLGCVLYEMIAGDKPMPARQRVKAMRRAADPVRPLRELRDDVSPRLEACVTASLVVDKADRTRTAGDLVHALQDCAHEYGVSVTPWKRLYWRAPGRVKAAAFATLALAIGGFGYYALVRRPRAEIEAPQSLAPVSVAGEPTDTSRILVLPFEHRGTIVGVMDEDDRVRDALKGWQGVDVVDRLNTREALSGRDTAHLTATMARDIGRALRAARYVRGEDEGQGANTTVRAALYDTRTGVALASATGTVRHRRTDSLYDALVMQLLFPELPESTVVRLRRGTGSRPALQAYAHSQAAIAAWDLATADNDLTSATTYDPQFALAYLWLAQVRSWREMSPATWQFAAHRAWAGRVRLGRRDRRVADALAAAAVLDSVKACDVWRSLTTGRDAENDFAAWYGVARCDYFDRTVIRDRRSPSGWSFRSSYHQATEAFRRAFQILPAIHREFRSSWYSALKRTLRTQRTQLRIGVAQRPDTGHFLAYPSWSIAGDSLEYIPYPMQAFDEGRGDIVPTTSRLATAHQRDVFLDIATTWRIVFGSNADALLAVGVALDEKGDSTATDSVHAARLIAEQAGDSASRLRAGAEEVWMLVKRSVPNDVGRLTLARALADTLLRAAADRRVDSTQATALASLAALTGHVHVAVRYAAADDDLVLGPANFKPTVRALEAYAALGAPVDSIAALATRLWRAPTAATSGERARWMRRAASIAFPVYHDSAIRELSRSGDFLAVVESASLDNDASTIRERLTKLHDARRMVGPEDLKLESLYPEAWLLASMGDTKAALDWISPTLDAQARSSTDNLQSVVAVGALVRGMTLRAKLESRLGHADDAARWARAVVALWENADLGLQPIVKEMKRLAR